MAWASQMALRRVSRQLRTPPLPRPLSLYFDQGLRLGRARAGDLRSRGALEVEPAACGHFVVVVASKVVDVIVDGVVDVVLVDVVTLGMLVVLLLVEVVVLVAVAACAILVVVVVVVSFLVSLVSRTLHDCACTCCYILSSRSCPSRLCVRGDLSLFL